MTRLYQSVLLGIVATWMLRLSLTDGFLTYVKPSTRPWLVAAGLVLALLAISILLSARRAEPDDDGEAHGHAHHAPHLAFLLALPVAAVFIAVPEPLGSFAASRQTSRQVDAPSEGYVFPPLPAPVNGAHELKLGEFNSRAFYDEDRSLEGQRVRLSGFALQDPEPDGGSFLVTRIVIFCCAADGMPISVRVVGLEGSPPETDTWVALEGTWLPGPAHFGSATLLADTLRVVPWPADSYEY